MWQTILRALEGQLGSAIRALVKLAAGYLLAHAWLAPEAADAWVNSASQTLLAVAMAALSQLWSVSSTTQGQRAVTAALSLPPDTMPPGASQTQIIEAAALLEGRRP